MALQPISGTALHIAMESVGSYPAFSPLPYKKAVVFCYLDSTFADSFPLGSMVPQSVARTFLLPKASDSSALCYYGGEIINFFSSDKLSMRKVLIQVKTDIYVL